MNTKKAELEIGKIKETGLKFNYGFDHNNINKFMFDIEQKGYSIEDIINKCDSGEKIIFMLNDGKTWNGKMGDKHKMIYSKKEDGSIYWIQNNRKCVRVDSDNNSIREWVIELEKQFNVES